MDFRVRAFAKSKRKGRPPNVLIEGPDRGTPEQQARRFKLIGDAPQELASYPLGVLMARKIITLDMENFAPRLELTPYQTMSRRRCRSGSIKCERP